jgi:hypothetical protein
MNCRRLALALSFASLCATTLSPVLADDSDWITLAQSTQPLVVTNPAKAVHNSEAINLQKGQEKLQLFLTYFDGTETAPSFKWLRIASPSMNYVSEQQFGGKKSLTMNVSGELTWSDNQLLVSGAGPAGASFSWILRTPKPTVTGISTQSVFSGNPVTITGTNFCSDADSDKVSIGGKPARIISASPTQLVVSVPEETKSGNLPIDVNVAGISVPTGINLQIQAQPYLRSLSSTFAAPGTTLTIYGEGFSSDVNQDVVYVGQFNCPVVSATSDSITISIVGALSDPWFAPNIASTGAFYPIKVMVGGVKARNVLTVRCSDVG